MKQLEVQIMGQSYLLGCPEGGESRLLDAVERVDTAMCKIRDAGKVRARDRIAVLAALNLAFDLDPVPAPTPSTSSMAAVPSTTVTPAESSMLLTSLLERLDAALGEDGQLL
ncbi:cell division protein ZapA [Curvibacter sp. APW13]|uniref:cell division protein ZapA n=1 Tax=Curvibacter sp. APW13 TaxID=3077236 RepID=UPI0028DD7259|nr:cell division protein ZapA [Curvibacter sp. APW13]MDT8991779.1 cell division protein ZapA [Curvibacter sp. APW13]